MNEDHSESNSDESDEDEFEEYTSWIIDPELMEEHLNLVAVCKQCHGSFEIIEQQTFRAGLGTKLTFQCVNCDASNNDSGFFTSKKIGKIFSINRLSVLGARILGKGWLAQILQCTWIV